VQDETIIAEFTQQAETFNASAVARAPEILDALMRLAAPQATERWLEAACGPGIISRKLAPHVREVHGVDMTPAMVDLARREAAQAGLANAKFAVGDTTQLDMPTASVDGAVARFAIHHVPVPSRLFAELARIVRPGGRIIMADHIADADADAAAWSQEIERLRDPSHWACLTMTRLRALGQHTGLELEHEQVFPIALDFEDWLQRGSGRLSGRPLIERALAERPDRADAFQVLECDGRRVLKLRMWLARWRR
jgi:SAM-dependent methyltransferase